MGEDEIKTTEDEPTTELVNGTVTEVEIETLVEVVPEPELVVEEKPKRKRKHVHVATYTGTAKDITLSGVGRIHPGKEFEVSERIANALKLDRNFEVKTTYKYIEV